MKPTAWLIAIVAVLVLFAACGAGAASTFALPCAGVVLAAYSYLAVTDHRENG